MTSFRIRTRMLKEGLPTRGHSKQPPIKTSPLMQHNRKSVSDDFTKNTDSIYAAFKQWCLLALYVAIASVFETTKLLRFFRKPPSNLRRSSEQQHIPKTDFKH